MSLVRDKHLLPKLLFFCATLHYFWYFGNGWSVTANSETMMGFFTCIWKRVKWLFSSSSFLRIPDCLYIWSHGPCYYSAAQCLIAPSMTLKMHHCDLLSRIWKSISCWWVVFPTNFISDSHYYFLESFKPPYHCPVFLLFLFYMHPLSPLSLPLSHMYYKVSSSFLCDVSFMTFSQSSNWHAWLLRTGVPVARSSLYTM